MIQPSYKHMELSRQACAPFFKKCSDRLANISVLTRSLEMISAVHTASHSMCYSYVGPKNRIGKVVYADCRLMYLSRSTSKGTEFSSHSNTRSINSSIVSSAVIAGDFFLQVPTNALDRVALRIVQWPEVQLNPMTPDGKMYLHPPAVVRLGVVADDVDLVAATQVGAEVIQVSPEKRRVAAFAGQAFGDDQISRPPV